MAAGIVIGQQLRTEPVTVNAENSSDMMAAFSASDTVGSRMMFVQDGDDDDAPDRPYGFGPGTLGRGHGHMWDDDGEDDDFFA